MSSGTPEVHPVVVNTGPILALEALKRHRGNLSQAALDLGISRPTLNAVLARMGVEARDFKRPKKG